MKYYLINRFNESIKFLSWEKAIYFINKQHIESIGNDFNNFRTYVDLIYSKDLNDIFTVRKKEYVSYILKDEFDRIIPLPIIKDAIKNGEGVAPKRKKINFSVQGARNKWKFRDYYRTNCNLQEKRRYEEDFKYCRIRKSDDFYRTSYDDYPKSRTINSPKTWKLHKIKKQWMKKRAD